ncbi:MAG: hypothetical protein Q7K29_00305 [Thermoleophilia bacterium]|nr:hypothetical protein [Thermoleophilia bacterium]
MSTRNLVEEQETFEAGISKWQEMEDLTIATCDEILAATDNKLVTTIAGIIKSDSTKHKMVLDVVKEALNGTITLTPDELGDLSELLEKHRDLEKETVELAAEQLELSRNFVVNHLVSYLLEDERKHFMLLHQLNDFKKKLYPYA